MSHAQATCPNLSDPPVVYSAPLPAAAVDAHQSLLYAAAILSKLFLIDVRNPPAMTPDSVPAWRAWRSRVICLAVRGARHPFAAVC